MKDGETLKNLKELIIPLSANPLYAPYIKPYNVLKSIEIRTNMTDENVFLSQPEVDQMHAQQAEMQRMQAEAEEAAAIDQVDAEEDNRELVESGAMLDIAGKVEEMEGRRAAEPTAQPPQKGKAK